MRVKYLAQEHNAVPRPGLEPRSPDPESSALAIKLVALVTNKRYRTLLENARWFRFLMVVPMIFLLSK